jgi:SAM-dependent methyltransferase
MAGQEPLTGTAGRPPAHFRGMAQHAIAKQLARGPNAGPESAAPVLAHPGVTVLDLGCGAGEPAPYLIERRCAVTDVDPACSGHLVLLAVQNEQ